MEEYHLRRAEKEITDDKELFDLILNQQFMTLALCRDNKPYLVTVNYYFDVDKRIFYFHCAQNGKKIDYIKSNPVVWGQVIEDNGYVQGSCDHSYRSVHFKGKAEFIGDHDRKLKILRAMMDFLEDEVTEKRKGNIANRNLDDVCICKISVEGFRGKTNMD